jgi:hypothetical protein
MATQAQIDANRRNAQKSTGPTTPEGRAAVRLNALKHGLTSELLLPSPEERPNFDHLCEAFHTEYQPVGPTEESLFENLVAAKWRLSRARKSETGFFIKRGLELDQTSEVYRDLPANGRLAMIVDSDSASDDTLSKISRYEARLERSFYKALSELRRAIEQREPAEPVATKQTQSEDQPPEPTPPPAANDPTPQPEPSENQHPFSQPVAAKQTQCGICFSLFEHSFATLNCYSRGRTAKQPSRRRYFARRHPVSTIGRLLLEAGSHRSIRLV